MRADKFPDRLNIWNKNKKNTKDNSRCFVRKIGESS